jgi:hypothetical protein
MMSWNRGREVSARPEAGFALILALLALVLLTFLGLTLATTTSSELQIASNYRWSQQALYNAEAGIEVGKIILRNIANDWGSVLPSVRSGKWSWGTPLSPGTPQSVTATRNFEFASCDKLTGTGYGGVLDDTQATPLLNGSLPAGPYENVRTYKGMTLNGAFTLWVRRDLKIDSDSHSSSEGQYSDNASNDILVLTAEGSAPRLSSALGASVRVLQVRLARGNQGNTSCSAAEGQTGIAASGANFGACAPLNSASISPVSSAGGGTGAELNVK